MKIKIEKAKHSDQLEPNSKQKESDHDEANRIEKNHPNQNIEEVENLTSEDVEVQLSIFPKHFIYCDMSRRS